MSFFGNRRQQPETDPPAASENPTQPRPVPTTQPVGFETVLGANCTIEGTLRSSSNVRLDGIFTGTLEITGNVLVGETAKITADINARNVSIAGAVRGNVSGKKVQLLRTGRIWGDITAAALTTEEGAFIDGKITMVSNDSARPEPSSREATLVLEENLPMDETLPEAEAPGSPAPEG
jgi:cytoskeletal protein CcmA (bactofilin family)